MHRLEIANNRVQVRYLKRGESEERRNKALVRGADAGGRVGKTGGMGVRQQMHVCLHQYVSIVMRITE